jgi:hypothetical protein
VSLGIYDLITVTISASILLEFQVKVTYPRVTGPRLAAALPMASLWPRLKLHEAVKVP